ncbi:MAG: hypothetical protein R8K46_02860, partial [Mariprofundaceae bacterium]
MARTSVAGARLGALLARWVGAAVRHAPWVLLAIAMLTAASLYYTSRHLGIHTNTDDMLAADLPFRQTYRTFEQQFPQFKDTILIVIDGEAPEMARDAARRLATRLRADAQFRDVYLPHGGDFLAAHAMLYMSQDELETLAD